MWYIGTIKMLIETNNWDVETYKNKSENLFFLYFIGKLLISFF